MASLLHACTDKGGLKASAFFELGVTHSLEKQTCMNVEHDFKNITSVAQSVLSLLQQLYEERMVNGHKYACVLKLLCFPDKSFQGPDFWSPSSRLTEPDIWKGLWGGFVCDSFKLQWHRGNGRKGRDRGIVEENGSCLFKCHFNEVNV